jgi:hypothetical protein
VLPPLDFESSAYTSFATPAFCGWVQAGHSNEKTVLGKHRAVLALKSWY